MGYVLHEITENLQNQLDGKLPALGTAVKATADASGNVITTTYATKNELTAGLNVKANTADLATVATSGKYSDLSGTPVSLKNPHSLSIQDSTGSNIGTYDGSVARTVTITAETVGLENVTNESKETMFTSPAFTGTPTAPTATTGTSSTQVATTAFVTTAVANKTDISGNAGTATKLKTARTISLTGDVSGSVSFDGSKNVSVTTTIADDSHNHVIDNVDGLQGALNLKAPLSSPALTGTPTAPTASASSNNTTIATTAFVTTAVANKKTIDHATNASYATADASGNVITSTYATKTENATNFTDAKLYAKSYTDTAIANLIDGAPETLDTLKEVAIPQDSYAPVPAKLRRPDASVL